MTQRGKAYLDGGPANGTLMELDQSNWAPIGTLKVEVDGVEVIYVRARQRDPRPGEPWRYVPRSEIADIEDDDPTHQGANVDPYDD